MPIVLASSSPRRKELLSRAGIDFEVIPSPAEEVHDASLSPAALCELNATLKAEAVATMRPEAIVIGSDTLVFIDKEPLGKPADRDAARVMLSRLAGRTHQVRTGVCMIFPGGTRKVFHETTDVSFLPLDAKAIDDYLSRVDPLDKAGAYGIQEHGELIVERIDGSFENVMGLPLEQVLAVLAAGE
jgi:septum formation protein